MNAGFWFCLCVTTVLLYFGTKLSPNGNDYYGFSEAARMLVWGVVTIVTTLIWLVWTLS